MGEIDISKIDWSGARSPDLRDFEAMADAAYNGLPDEFRQLCEGLVIRIEDFPSEEVLAAMKCESEFDLLGLFQGRGLAQSGATLHTGATPNMIWLYRRPILDYWTDHDETLGALISHVLVHEIGHHFGLSDADMDEIERQAD